MKDPQIMLFGKKIFLPENIGGDCSGELSDEIDSSSFSDKVNKRSDDQYPCEVNRGDEIFDGGDQKHDEDQTSSGDQNSETITDQEDVVDHNASPPEESSKPHDNNSSEDHSPNTKHESKNTNQNEPLKKPDKILPCPRCNSKDTKFCYYNNYNVNQPRHFCKSCQRYWTAGGTMRNVPVGAGRRKNKSSTAHYRHVTISEEAFHRINHNDPINGYDYHHRHQPDFNKINGTVLSFCSDSSSAVVSPNGGVNNGYYNIDQGGSFSIKDGEKGVRDCKETLQNGLFHSKVPFGSGVMWPIPWNSQVPIPGILYPGYPIPVYPNWNVPWPLNDNSGSRNNSLLGKRSRNGELLSEQSTSDKSHNNKHNSSGPTSSVVVPKTLRIDDPEEAAKSSIWTTLGIKYDNVRREALFKSLQPKKDEKKQMVTTSPLLQANPAALSRSICFQERA